MIVGIMQPYLFPYLGYFQLMNAVDKYVFYDDVNYIKQGWINRNRILENGKAHLFSFELIGASSFKLIKEIQIKKNEKIKKTLSQIYGKAPFFKTIFPIIETILDYEDTNLAGFVINSLKRIAQLLDFKTEFYISSEIHKNNLLKGQDKVISICKILGGTSYYNAIGGQELYSKDIFLSTGIDLKFLKTIISPYKQFDNEFVPGLSIIDVLMFNSIDKIHQMCWSSI
jgi:hypothetical protein